MNKVRRNGERIPVHHRELVWPPRWLQSGSEARSLAACRQWQPRIWHRPTHLPATMHAEPV